MPCKAKQSTNIITKLTKEITIMRKSITQRDARHDRGNGKINSKNAEQHRTGSVVQKEVKVNTVLERTPWMQEEGYMQ
jgi:hypothetical protein